MDFYNNNVQRDLVWSDKVRMVKGEGREKKVVGSIPFLTKKN